MDRLRACFCEPTGDPNGIRVIDRNVRFPTLRQSNALPVFEIDCRYDLHADEITTDEAGDRNRLNHS